MSRSPYVSALEHIAGRLERDVGNFAPARAVYSEVNRLRTAAVALDEFKANRSPLVTPEAHTKSLGTNARKLNSEVTATTNRLLAAALEGQRVLRSSIEEKVKLKPHADAKEIRDRFNSLKPAERSKQLADWANGNHGPELAAITETSPFLAGISAEEQARWRDAIIGKHAPEEFEGLQRLDQAVEDAFVATRNAGDFANSLTDPGELARIERAHEAASAAGIAFDEALSNVSASI